MSKLVVQPLNHQLPAIWPPLLKTPASWRHESVRVNRPHHTTVIAEERTIIAGRPNHAVMESAARPIAFTDARDITFEQRLQVAMMIDATLGEPPPPWLLRALAAVWGISDTAASEATLEAGGELTEDYGRRVRKRLQTWPDTSAAGDTAVALVAGKVARKHRVGLHRVLRWFGREGYTLTWEVRRAAAKASGLLDPEGRDWSDAVGLEVFDKYIVWETGEEWRVRNIDAFRLALGRAAAEVYGVPWGDTEAQQERDEHLRTHPSATELARVAGVTPKTITSWRKHPDWPRLVIGRAIDLKS